MLFKVIISLLLFDLFDFSTNQNAQSLTLPFLVGATFVLAENILD